MFDGASPAYRRVLAWVIAINLVGFGAALFKGGSLAVMAVAILGFAVWRAMSGTIPDAGAISGLGLFGAAANLVAAILLSRYRDGDANVRSVWLCTRNDLIQCVAVAATGAAVAVALTGSRWPDLAVGVFLAVVFLRSAWQITYQARAELRAAGAAKRRDTYYPSTAAVLYRQQ